MPSRTLPHLKEQFGRAAVEAMAAGVPVVAYDSGALGEVIGDTGVLVPEGDRDGLVQVGSSSCSTIPTGSASEAARAPGSATGGARWRSRWSACTGRR